MFYTPKIPYFLWTIVRIKLKFGCLRRHRDPISMSSCCKFLRINGYTTAMRGNHESCCLPKTIGHVFVSFVLYSQGEICLMSPMITRKKDEDGRIRQDAFTMTSRRARWTHEFNTKTHRREAFRELFDMPKIFAPFTKLLPEPEKVHRRPYDGLRCPYEWPDVFTIRAEFENFNHRVSILCQLRYSVAPALELHQNHCLRTDRS